LALEVMLGARDMVLPIGAIRFLIAVVVAGSSCDLLEAPFLALLASIGAFFCHICQWLGLVSTVVAGGHFPITLNKDGPDRLLTRGMTGGDVK
jgi:hypothetical protein